MDLNWAGQSNMQGSTQVYNDVFVSKDPQAHFIQKKTLLYKFTTNSGAF